MVSKVGSGIVETFNDFFVVLSGKKVRDFGTTPSLAFSLGFFYGEKNRRLGGGCCILYISELHFF